jgi:hypothetical protein
MTNCQYPFINNKFLKRSYDIFVDKEITVIYKLFMSHQEIFRIENFLIFCMELITDIGADNHNRKFYYFYCNPN